jgi:hypothetical protein
VLSSAACHARQGHQPHSTHAHTPTRMFPCMGRSRLPQRPYFINNMGQVLAGWQPALAPPAQGPRTKQAESPERGRRTPAAAPTGHRPHYYPPAEHEARWSGNPAPSRVFLCCGQRAAMATDRLAELTALASEPTQQDGAQAGEAAPLLLPTPEPGPLEEMPFELRETVAIGGGGGGDGTAALESLRQVSERTKEGLEQADVNVAELQRMRCAPVVVLSFCGSAPRYIVGAHTLAATRFGVGLGRRDFAGCGRPTHHTTTHPLCRPPRRPPQRRAREHTARHCHAASRHRGAGLGDQPARARAQAWCVRKGQPRDRSGGEGSEG